MRCEIKVTRKDVPLKTLCIRQGFLGNVYIIVSIPDTWTSKAGDVVVRGYNEMISLRTGTYSNLEYCDEVMVRAPEVGECIEITRLS